MATMNTKQAIEILNAASEDNEWTHEEARELFEALIGRPADDSDGDTGEIISHCYAALPVSPSRWERMADRADYLRDMSKDPSEQ